MKGKIVFKKGERTRLVFRDAGRCADEIDATDTAWTLAREAKGVEAMEFLASVDGTGKDGRITANDVRSALAQE